MTEAIALRSKYLRDAAHLLAVSSPSACAFLGTARDQLIENSQLEVQPKERDTFRRETCGACGNLMIPGWSCKISNDTQTQKPSREGKRTTNDSVTSETSLIYKCLRCNRQTKQILPSRSQRRMRKKKSIAISNLETASTLKKEDDTKMPKTTNASSKQRQKARKGGLQAMLDKNKTQAAKPGYDLMDFAM
ncbi:hypothetical protein CC86DRAFT_2265 [Ophiobolus disseminans]|uniref:Rpr2-domain-containing protein n=1 Tax=Ophiobolus disseminans TaxID=1469910 RepID=A0A6A7AIK7_9PLEO|nr:hypothetical protein CC86DRAFT_2265 [Ophiobolus disseminans]